MPFDSAALQALIDGGPGVISVTGDYVLASAVSMRPGIHLRANNASITQAADANLTSLIEFNAYSAHGSSVEGFVLDGNRSGNTDADILTLAYVGTANNVTIKDNIFRNIPGVGVYVTTGQYPKVINNDFQNIRTMCVAFISPTGSETAGEIRYNTCSNQLGQHGIYVARSNGNRIEKNRIYGTQIRGTCWSNQHSASSTASDFAGLQAGGFLIGYPGGNYTEGYITSVDSANALTVRESLPAANYTFIAGTGDLINIGNSFRNVVSGNILTGGAGGGIVIHNFYGGAGAYQMETVIENNELYYIGGSGISVQSTPTTPATMVLDTTIQNNRIVSCGMGLDAVRAVGRNGISLIDFSAAGLLGSVAIVGNRIQNEAGLATMSAAIYNANVPASQVYINNPLTYGV